MICVKIGMANIIKVIMMVNVIAIKASAMTILI